MVNVPRHCSNLHQSAFIIFIAQTCKILVVLVKTLAADEKYPIFHTENLTIPIQMVLSEKEKTFSQFFAAFLKPRLTFK